jgi:hypothetical protein
MMENSIVRNCSSSHVTCHRHQVRKVTACKPDRHRVDQKVARPEAQREEALRAEGPKDAVLKAGARKPDRHRADQKVDHRAVPMEEGPKEEGAKVAAQKDEVHKLDRHRADQKPDHPGALKDGALRMGLAEVDLKADPVKADPVKAHKGTPPNVWSITRLNSMPITTVNWIATNCSSSLGTCHPDLVDLAAPVVQKASDHHRAALKGVVQKVALEDPEDQKLEVLVVVDPMALVADRKVAMEANARRVRNVRNKRPGIESRSLAS